MRASRRLGSADAALARRSPADTASAAAPELRASAAHPPSSVLLTGGTGHLGRWVVAGLKARGVRVTTFAGRQLATPTRATERALRRCLRDVDVVCHLAGATPLQPGPPSRETYRRANVETTRHLLEAASALGGRHFVLASTAMIGGLPTIPGEPGCGRVDYAESKRIAEELVEAFTHSGGSGISLRMNALGGPGNDPARGVIAAALDAAHRGTTFAVFGCGDAGRDYLHVYDAALAVIAAVQRRANRFQAVEIGSGQLATTEDVLTAAERVTRRPIRRVYLAPRADVADRPACDIRVAEAVLGWTPLRSDLETIVRDQWATHVVVDTSAH